MGETALDLKHAQTMLEWATDFVSSATIDGRVTFLNQAGRKLLQLSNTYDVTTLRIEDIHPAWGVQLICDRALPSAMENGSWLGDAALLTRDGREIKTSQRIVVHYDETGEAVQYSTIIRTSEQASSAGEDFHSGSNMLQLVLDYVPQCIFWKDRNSVYQGCNRNFAKVAGVKCVEDIVGKTDFDLAWKREEAEFFRKVDSEVMSSDTPRTHIIEPQLQADGKQAWLDTSKLPLHDECGNVAGMLGMFEDITERKANEEQLRQNQKMDSLGEIAGGIAHDFNNMLMVMRGGAEMLSLLVNDAPEKRHIVNEILDAADNAASLTQRLLDFARKGGHSREAVDIHEVVDAAVSLLKRTVDRKIEIAVDLNASRSTLIGDPSQLQSLIMNLGLNARDAMEDGGLLSIRTNDVILEDRDARVDAMEIKAGHFLEIVVTDTGLGMNADVSRRVFEPFFTTKGVGAGTGLGLSASYSTVVEHNGAITLTSQPGIGTEFRIYLPIDKASHEEVRAKFDTLRSALPDNSTAITILLVDDEELVRSVAGAMLETLGYSVIVAENGLQALDIFSHEQERIDLILLDMVMPKLNGRETLVKIREMNSHIPVVFCSGFTRARVEVDGESISGFIKKPYRLTELAETISDALASGTARIEIMA